MNRKLTEQIVYHIFAHLGVLPSVFVNRETTKSIIDKPFLLSEKVSLENDKGEVIRKNIYGCQARVADSKEFKMLLADCTEDEKFPEYCLLVQLKDAPAFGMYLIYTESEEVDPEELIAVSADKEHWMPCSIYLQSTFLAGMEQVRDTGFAWGKCTNYQEQYQQLLSFIKFHHGFYGVSDEGQEG